MDISLPINETFRRRQKHAQRHARASTSSRGRRFSDDGKKQASRRRTWRNNKASARYTRRR